MESPRVEEVQERLSSTVLVKSGNPSSHEWIADIEATDHMSPKKSLFSQYSSTKVTHRVQMAGGGTLPLNGVGGIPLSSLGFLKEILHIEDLRANLIYIQKLVDDYGWQFILDSDDSFLCDKVFGMRISSFRQEGGLLLLNASPQQCLVSWRTCSKEERVIRLHQRMGHLPFDLLRACYPSLFHGIPVEQLFCEACPMEKL